MLNDESRRVRHQHQIVKASTSDQSQIATPDELRLYVEAVRKHTKTLPIRYDHTTAQRIIALAKFLDQFPIEHMRHVNETPESMHTDPTCKDCLQVALREKLDAFPRPIYLTYLVQIISPKVGGRDEVFHTAKSHDEAVDMIHYMQQEQQ